MIISFSDELTQGKEPFQWEDLILWKADLAGAFTLLNFRSGDVHLLACELTDSLTLIYHTGLFGWTGTPFAFQVVTRALRRNINKLIKGKCQMYVDDILGITLKKWLAHDQASTYNTCTTLLGPTAIAKHKWESGRRIDMIGWSVDLDQNCISIAKKNFLKTFFGFFDIDTEQKIPMRVIETLAAYSSRYTLIFRIMRPFTTVLYTEIRGLRNRDVSIFLSAYCKVAIWMWRLVLCQLRLDERNYARTLDSFIIIQPDVSIEYDAAVGDGIGISIRDLRLRGDTLIGIGRMTFPYSLDNNPMYQNLAEFTAVVIGCVCLAQRGYTNINVRLLGDNKTSLKWGKTERFKGLLCRCACIYFSRN
jgi:hypothetical protein